MASIGADTSPESSSLSTSAATNPICANIVTVNPNDVVLGRGAPFVHFTGNVRFREIVADRQEEYSTASKRKHKVNIARDIFDLIASRNGCFLRRIETQEDCRQLDERESENGWVVADESVAMEKIKQALRHRERSKFPPSNAEVAPATSATTGASTTISGNTLVEPVVAARGPIPHLFVPPRQNVLENMPQLNGIYLMTQAAPDSNQLSAAFWREQQQSNNEQLGLVGQQRIELGRREIILRQQQVHIQQQLDTSAVQSMMPSFGSAYGTPAGMHGVIANSLSLNGSTTSLAPSGPAASFVANEIQRMAFTELQRQTHVHQLQQLMSGSTVSQNMASQSGNSVAAAISPMPHSGQQPDSTTIDTTYARAARSHSPNSLAPRPSSQSGTGNREKRLKSNRSSSSSSSNEDRKRKADDKRCESSSPSDLLKLSVKAKKSREASLKN